MTSIFFDISVTVGHLQSRNRCLVFGILETLSCGAKIKPGGPMVEMETCLRQRGLIRRSDHLNIRERADRQIEGLRIYLG
jgi:hypothetical protein